MGSCLNKVHSESIRQIQLKKRKDLETREPLKYIKCCNPYFQSNPQIQIYIIKDSQVPTLDLSSNELYNSRINRKF